MHKLYNVCALKETGEDAKDKCKKKKNSLSLEFRL